jgi:1-phosphofructokinase
MSKRHPNEPIEVVTVTLNPAIDQTLDIPEFAAGKVNRVRNSCARPGGKGVNVAAALSDFKVSVGVTGFLGRDNAAGFEVMFAARRIEDHFIRVPGQTRTGIKIADAALQQTTDINFPGLAPRRADLSALTRTLDRLAAPGRWFVLSGSLPPGLDAGTYARLVARLRKSGAKILLDTSGEPLRQAIEAWPDIIKPNVHELEALVGRRLTGVPSIVRAVRPLLARGIEMAAVSMGEKGACFVTPEQCVVALPPKVKVKSTVGAGDAMVAGILAARLVGASLETTARMATAFALEVLTRGQSGLSSKNAVGRWAKCVVCTQGPRLTNCP